MADQETLPAFAFARVRCAAFRRTGFIKEFGSNDYNNGPAPVSDGITKERAKMRFWIKQTVADEPGDKQSGGDNAE